MTKLGSGLRPSLRRYGTLALAGIGLGALLPTALGCESRITGNEGNFSFSYEADDDALDFNKPIAVGAKLNLEVRLAGDSRDPIALETAVTDDEAVLAVESFTGHEIILNGVAPGSAQVQVTGPGEDGEVVEDSVDMLVAEPEVLKLWHYCDRDATTAAYQTGASVRLGFDMERENGQAVIGYGVYPVESSDAGFSLVASESSQRTMVFDTGSAAVDVTLSSTIDSTTRDAKVVTEGMVDGVAEPVGFVVEDLDVGEEYAFYVLPKVGEAKVCQSTFPNTVVSDTPDLCAVEEFDPPAESDLETGWFKLEGLAAGECMFTVTYTGGAGGAGVSEQFSYTVEP